MTTTEAEQEVRAGYIAGLRRIADALEADPSLPLPYDGTGSEFSVFTDSRDELVRWARVLDGKRDKEVTSDSNYGFKLHGVAGSLRVLVYAPREQVCTRRVIGTREVTREVPDPAALAAVPTVTVTETVEEVEWDCGPILATRDEVPA